MKEVDIIWNITKICPWDCAICCVDAIHVTKKSDIITVKSENLSQEETLNVDRNEQNIYTQTSRLLQSKGKELAYNEKLRVLQNLSGFNVKIDFSGGDPLVLPENIELIKRSCNLFGKTNITLTATGAGLSKCNVQELSLFIGEYNFTFDSDNANGKDNRPNYYAQGNFRKAAEFVKAGVNTRAELPLTTQNISNSTLENIYLALKDIGVSKLLIMRLFPVGRGILKPEMIPTNSQYKQAISFLRQLQNEYNGPMVKLQCALKYFDNPHSSINPCDVVYNSFGLTSDGTLLASPWAINSIGQPLDEVWVLGNLSKTHLSNILSSARAQEFYKKGNENFGHCKIFSFMNSSRIHSLDKIFDTTDPLITTSY